MKIPAKLFDKMKQSASESFVQLDAGRSCLDIIVEMYRQALPERTPEEAETVARRIRNQVNSYHRAYSHALSDEMGWIDEQIDDLCMGRSRLERCQLMAQLVDGMLMLSGGVSGDYTPGRQSQAYTEENATRQVEIALREQLRQIVANSGMDESRMGELSQLLDECGVEEAAETVVDFGEKQFDVDAIYAMIAYLNGQNHVRGFDSKLTPEEAALAVCAAGDKLRTAHRVSIGEITAQIGAKLLRVIGSVSGFLLDIALCLLVGGAAFITLYTLSMFLEFGMAVVITGAVAAAALTGAVMFSGSVKLGQDIAMLPVKIVKGVAGLLVKGGKAIANAVNSRTARPMRINPDMKQEESASSDTAEAVREPTAGVANAAVEATGETASVDA